MNINIDIGGTFTDFAAVRENKIHAIKTPTTSYDLSVCVMSGLKDLSRDLGLTLEETLKETENIRYSTTLAMNTLIQRKGPELALLVTEGFEDLLVIARASQWFDGVPFKMRRDTAGCTKTEPLIRHDFIAGVRERVNYKGEVLLSIDEHDLINKIHELVWKGARGFAVCLLFAHKYPAHEKRIREIIRELYPESLLGSVPVMLSSEIAPKTNEYERLNSTILNAYLHGSMSEELRSMGDELRDSGYQAPLIMVHNTGGMAEVFRTTALQTFDGGPVAGLFGCLHVGKQMGLSNILLTDMGGTSFDIGLIEQGIRLPYAWYPIIDRFLINQTMVDSISIGAGGGSIAYQDKLTGRMMVGPESAQSMPGPACYDLGGTDPTVTDADVVLGYVNPEYYLGGKIPLNRDKAIEVIEEKIAKPFGIGVTEAAYQIKTIIDGVMGGRLYREMVLKGHDPREYACFAVGGAGPTHACGYAFGAGIPTVVTFPYSSVFCAFGSSGMDIVIMREIGKPMRVLATGTKETVLDYDTFNLTVEELTRDITAEARLMRLPMEKLTFELELTMAYVMQPNRARIHWPKMHIHSETDVGELYKKYEEEYVRLWHAYSALPDNGVEITAFTVKGIVPQPLYSLPTYEKGSEKPPASAHKGQRLAYWHELGDCCKTDIYEQDYLRCGNKVEGPAVVESPNTTLVLPPRTTLTVDRFLCFRIQKS